MGIGSSRIILDDVYSSYILWLDEVSSNILLDGSLSTKTQLDEFFVQVLLHEASSSYDDSSDDRSSIEIDFSKKYIGVDLSFLFFSAPLDEDGDDEEDGGLLSMFNLPSSSLSIWINSLSFLMIPSFLYSS